MRALKELWQELKRSFCQHDSRSGVTDMARIYKVTEWVCLDCGYKWSDTYQDPTDPTFSKHKDPPRSGLFGDIFNGFPFR